MVEYTCNKCYKIFSHKGNYLYHVQKRKKECTEIFDKFKNSVESKKILKKNIEKQLEITNNIIPSTIIDVFDKNEEDKESEELNKFLDNKTFDISNLPIFNVEFNESNCVYCNRMFMTNSHRNRHMNNNCPIRKKYIDLIKILDAEFEKQYLENKFLRNKYMALFGDKYLFAFGTEKFVGYNMTMIIDAIKNPYKGIPDLIESYHFNPIETRYNNIRIKNPRHTHFEIYNGTGWSVETKECVIQTLIRVYKDIIDMEVENLASSLPPGITKSYNDFSEFMDYYLSYLIYDTELSPFKKRYAKPIYTKLYTQVDLMIINAFRRDICSKIEEEMNTIKTDIQEQ